MSMNADLLSEVPVRHPTVRVVAEDIDRHGHVNNSIYLRWIEKAVHDQWMESADAVERLRFDWLAVRHEIDYRKPAFSGDRLSIEVRLQSVRRARAWYGTKIVRDGQIIVEASSCWCCIDTLTQRLTVVPQGAAARLLGIVDTMSVQ
ncbi:acyl-CoA thioesterase [Flavisphingomonas formosensis]|uniref:acyl-CoA thioesterase n=1 Tax=Flavisphingomonas formosensis TaxID=861534 RepID=UPI0012FC3910|nr:thioesterase family protein [Sphingomonas formosensis]